MRPTRGKEGRVCLASLPPREANNSIRGPAGQTCWDFLPHTSQMQTAKFANNAKVTRLTLPPGPTGRVSAVTTHQRLSSGTI